MDIWLFVIFAKLSMTIAYIGYVYMTTMHYKKEKKSFVFLKRCDTFKAQKGSKDIIKIVHVTSVVQL